MTFSIHKHNRIIVLKNSCVLVYLHQINPNFDVHEVMIQKNHVPKDVFRFIDNGRISKMDNLITWNFQNEFGLELQIMHSFR